MATVARERVGFSFPNIYKRKNLYLQSQYQPWV